MSPVTGKRIDESSARLLCALWFAGHCQVESGHLRLNEREHRAQNPGGGLGSALTGRTFSSGRKAAKRRPVQRRRSRASGSELKRMSNTEGFGVVWPEAEVTEEQMAPEPGCRGRQGTFKRQSSSFRWQPGF